MAGETIRLHRELIHREIPELRPQPLCHHAMLQSSATEKSCLTTPSLSSMSTLRVFLICDTGRTSSYDMRGSRQGERNRRKAPTRHGGTSRGVGVLAHGV